MQGDGTTIPMDRNESNHMGPTGMAGSVYRPPLSDQPRPAPLWHSPLERRGVVCALPPES
jgi:hypothetical protein